MVCRCNTLTFGFGSTHSNDVDFIGAIIVAIGTDSEQISDADQSNVTVVQTPESFTDVMSPPSKGHSGTIWTVNFS